LGVAIGLATKIWNQQPAGWVSLIAGAVLIIGNKGGPQMNLEIRSFADAGNFDKERIVLKALRDVDVGEFVVFGSGVSETIQPSDWSHRERPWHFLYFFPLPHGHGTFVRTLGTATKPLPPVAF